MLRRKLLFATTLPLLGSSMLFGQTLEITPNSILVDEVPVIRATGLQPNQRVAIRAELIDGADHPWKSEAEFVADSQGSVDVSRQAPVKGSYNEASAAGLLWSMLPNEKNETNYESPRNLAPQSIQFSLLKNGALIATAKLEQHFVAEGVRRIPVTGQLHGALFIPPTTERHPAVLVLGGSEGGVPVQRAAWLASRGYVAFALAYFRYEDLPPQLAGIPLEYFGRALGWLIERPEVLPDRIAVVGASRGGELALQLGAIYPQIKAVVAYVPANFRHAACCDRPPVPYAWTVHGSPLSYVPIRSMHNAAEILQAAIPVERTNGPILVISGQDDGVWDSSNMSDAVVDRLKHAHFPYLFEHLKYQHAGHRAGRPEIVPTWHGRIKHPVSGKSVSLGGSASGDAQSSIDAIPKVLDFLHRSLQDSNSK